MKTKLTIFVFIGLIWHQMLIAQVTTLGTFPGAPTDYVGWQTLSGIPLTIKNEDADPINFYTDAGTSSPINLRMFIQGNDGHVGIGSFTTANTLLHLHQASTTDTVVDLQMTNVATGNNVDDGSLIRVDPDKAWNFYQQEEDRWITFFTQSPVTGVLEGRLRIANDINGGTDRTRVLIGFAESVYPNAKPLLMLDIGEPFETTANLF